MPRALPPWLNVAPSQFTEAAISGAQLGAKGATEAAQLGLEAAKVAQQAQELQARRDAISAQFAAVNQRSSEASMENAIRNRQVALQEQVSRDSAAKMAANDNVWQEGMSRYERAVNAGDDPEAAAFEILAPLQQAGFGGGKREIKPPSATGMEYVPLNYGGGRAASFNRRTGETIPLEVPALPQTEVTEGKMSDRQKAEYNDLRDRRRILSTKLVLNSADKKMLADLDERISNFFGAPKTSTGTTQFNEGQRIRNRKTGKMGTYRDGKIIPD